MKVKVRLQAEQYVGNPGEACQAEDWLGAGMAKRRGSGVVGRFCSLRGHGHVCRLGEMSCEEQKAECRERRHVERSKKVSPGEREAGRDWEHSKNLRVPWEGDNSSARRTPSRLRPVGSQSLQLGSLALLSTAQGCFHRPRSIQAPTPWGSERGAAMSVL